MNKIRNARRQKYIAMMIFSIILCCITVYANEQAVNEVEEIKQTQQNLVENKDEIIELLEQIESLKKEVEFMKEEMNEVRESNNKTYIAQKDVNAFEETSSYSKLNGTFKAGSVIQIDEISEDNIWGKTEQGFVKLMFLTKLDNATGNVLFEKTEDENKTEDNENQISETTTEYRTGVTGKSGLTKSDLDYLLAGSPMADCGDEVLTIEEKNNVNAFFTISVAQAETQRGRTGTGKSKNNAFGITNPSKGGYRYFSSLGESVLEFGGMMERVYISKGRDTISKVHAIYTDSPEWGTNVNTIMNKELAKIKAK